jgi:DNA polymerase
MADTLNNMARFIEQEIELYGNDFCMTLTDAEMLSSPQDEPSAWQDASSLEDMEQAINSCQNCALGQSRQRFVFGAGNPAADIVFIGEAPGADEDRIGQPFVGKAGELLTRILAAIDLKRQDVYICNILKCRPPHNRDPLPEEIATCKPYLLKQLQLLQPKAIVCLGRISAQVLLETTESLSKLRNRWFSFAGAQLLVTYHPAALLRNPAYKRETWEDMKRLRQFYKNDFKIN